MTFLAGAVVGLFVGGTVGVLLMAIVANAKHTNEQWSDGTDD